MIYYLLFVMFSKLYLLKDHISVLVWQYELTAHTYTLHAGTFGSSLHEVMHSDQYELGTEMWRTTVDHPAAAASVFHYTEKRAREREWAVEYFSSTAQAHILTPSQNNNRPHEK